MTSNRGWMPRRGGVGEHDHQQHALDVILAFSGVKSEVAEAFRKDIKQYAETEDRRAKSDEMRRLRMGLADGFYQIYEAAFFKSVKQSHTPAESADIFLFGFMDGRTGQETNTAALYRAPWVGKLIRRGAFSPSMTQLTKIYTGGCPSKNGW